MHVRKIPAGQGMAWFRAAIDLGGRNPKAVFGAAVLLIAVLYAIALVVALVAMTLSRATPGTAPNTAVLLAVAVPLFVGMMVLLPILLGGLMHVIREAEAGRPVRARDLFAPFRSGRAGALAALGGLQIVLAILSGLIVVAIAGPNYWQDYIAFVQGATGGATPVAPPQPRHPGLLFLMQVAFNYFTYAIMLFSVPLVLFSGAKLADAVRGSLSASVRNIGANVLAAALFVLGTIVAAIVVVLLTALANMLGNLLHPAVGTLLSLVWLLTFGAALLVVLAGGAYIAWRDTFDAPPGAPPAFNGIEA